MKKDTMLFIKNRIIWSLKQLFPFKYKGTYLFGKERTYMEWRMLLGKCFNIKSTVLSIEGI